MTQQLWIPKIAVLEPLVVIPNGTTCRCRELYAIQWEEKPKEVLAYYRLATEAEQAELLPKAA